MTATSPTLRQRELGTRLRHLRLGQDLTVEEVGRNFSAPPRRSAASKPGPVVRVSATSATCAGSTALANRALPSSWNSRGWPASKAGGRNIPT